MELTKDELRVIINLFECEWIRYLEEEEEALLKKIKKGLNDEN
jgi:hypothetical protein